MRSATATASCSLSTYLGERLAEMRDSRRIVSATRGIGLMHTIEVQRNLVDRIDHALGRLEQELGLG